MNNLNRATSVAELRKKYSESLTPERKKTLAERKKVEEAWNPMDDYDIRDAVEQAVSFAMENAFYEGRQGKFKDFDDLEEKVRESLDQGVDETSILDLDLNKKIDLCMVAEEETGEGCDTSWEMLTGVIASTATTGLYLLASGELWNMLKPIDDIVSKERLNWKHLSFHNFEDPMGNFPPASVDTVKGFRNASKYEYRNVEGDFNTDVYEIRLGEKGNQFTIWIQNHRI